MPNNENNLRLVFDDRDYATLKQAAAIDTAPNLRAYCSRILLDHARSVINNFRSQGTSPESGAT